MQETMEDLYKKEKAQERCGKCDAPVGLPHKSLECAEKSLRYNAGKTRWSLFPFDAAAEIVKVLMYGADKYAPGNWQKGCNWMDTYDSLMRHMVAYRAGEDVDPGSGLLHLGHAGCNILFLLWYQLHKIGEDDRQIELPLREHNND